MTLHKADQVNVVSDKVKLTKEQAEAVVSACISWEKHQIVKIHLENPNDWCNDCEALSGIKPDTIIRALYIGYEVEQSTEEKIYELWKSQKYSKADDQIRTEYGIERVLEIIGMKVKGINE